MEIVGFKGILGSRPRHFALGTKIFHVYAPRASNTNVKLIPLFLNPASVFDISFNIYVIAFCFRYE